LLENGADPNIKDENDSAPIDESEFIKEWVAKK